LRPEWCRSARRASLRHVSSPLAIALDALYLALRLSLPVLGVAFVVASLVGLVQKLTQLREPVLNGIARLLSVGLVLSLSFSAFAGELVSFSTRLYRELPALLAAP
jgi:flagellar biosynthetic protein FliQ